VFKCRVGSLGKAGVDGDVDARLEEFVECCRHRFGWEVKIEKTPDGTVILASEQPASPEEEFYFRFRTEDGAIFLANLKIPAGKRRQGVGSACVNWLKETAGDLGFAEIILESYPSAVGFWEKMGFSLKEEEEEF